MASKLDKELAEKRKRRDEDLEERVARCNAFWRIFFIHPATYIMVVILGIMGLGVYWDWNLKLMIIFTFKYGLTILTTALLQNFINEKVTKKIV
jgi:hypothetical protein